MVYHRFWKRNARALSVYPGRGVFLSAEEKMRRAIGTSVLALFLAYSTSCKVVEKYKHEEFVEGMELYAEQVLPKYRKFVEDDPALKTDAAKKADALKSADDCQAAIAGGKKNPDHKAFVQAMDRHTQQILPKYKAYVAASSLKEDTKKIRTRTADEWRAFVDDAVKRVGG